MIMCTGTLTDYRLGKLNSIGFVWSAEGDGRGGNRRRKKKEDLPKPKAHHSVIEPTPRVEPTSVRTLDNNHHALVWFVSVAVRVVYVGGWLTWC
jgi:hypothetical protein